MHSGPPPLPQLLSHSLRSIRFPFLCVPDAQDSGAVTQSFWDKVRCVGTLARGFFFRGSQPFTLTPPSAGHRPVFYSCLPSDHLPTSDP